MNDVPVQDLPMQELPVQDGNIIFRDHGALRRITLNRPQALNAITLDMAVTMTAALPIRVDGPHRRGGADRQRRRTRLLRRRRHPRAL